MNPTILICDSEESTREALKTILANQVNLIVVESHAQCLQVLKQKSPLHLAFVGVLTEDGFETEIFEELRSMAPELVIIAIGDYKSEEAAIDAVRQGATGYMIKPFKAEEIMALTARVK